MFQYNTDQLLFLNSQQTLLKAVQKFEYHFVSPTSSCLQSWVTFTGTKELAKKCEIISLMNLNELEIRKMYYITYSYRLVALEILNDSQDLNRTWESCKETIKTSAKVTLVLHELKQHKEWIVEECLRCLAQRKQVKMQWLQDTNHSNVHNMNNIRRDTSRNFRNKNKVQVKVKID